MTVPHQAAPGVVLQHTVLDDLQDANRNYKQTVNKIFASQGQLHVGCWKDSDFCKFLYLKFLRSIGTGKNSKLQNQTSVLLVTVLSF